MSLHGSLSVSPPIPASPRRLVLFDIDGTLLTSGAAAPRAFRQALEEVFGTSGPTEGYSFAGRTDPGIARDLLGMAGIDETTIDAGLPTVFSLYLEKLRRALEIAPPTVFPGVSALLERLDGMTDQVVTGLLTGNVVEGARLKLEMAGLGWDRYRIGAFGSDHHIRSALPAVAIDRAMALQGHPFAGKSVVIIGDTPADISCGAHLGVCSIAVATGEYGMDDLRPHGPDHLFADLSDLDAVMGAILPG